MIIAFPNNLRVHLDPNKHTVTYTETAKDAVYSEGRCGKKIYDIRAVLVKDVEEAVPKLQLQLQQYLAAFRQRCVLNPRDFEFMIYYADIRADGSFWLIPSITAVTGIL